MLGKGTFCTVRKMQNMLPQPFYNYAHCICDLINNIAILSIYQNIIAISFAILLQVILCREKSSSHLYAIKILKKEARSVHCHFLPIVVIHCHLLSFIVIHYHLLSFIAIYCHLLSLITIYEINDNN